MRARETSSESTHPKFATDSASLSSVVTAATLCHTATSLKWTHGIRRQAVQSRRVSDRCLRALQAEVLEALRPTHPLADVVLQHRSVHKLLTGFIHTLACFLDRVPRPPSADGKVGINTAVLLSL